MRVISLIVVSALVPLLAQAAPVEPEVKARAVLPPVIIPKIPPVAPPMHAPEIHPVSNPPAAVAHPPPPPPPQVPPVAPGKGLPLKPPSTDSLAYGVLKGVSKGLSIGNDLISAVNSSNCPPYAQSSDVNSAGGQLTPKKRANFPIGKFAIAGAKIGAKLPGSIQQGNDPNDCDIVANGVVKPYYGTIRPGGDQYAGGTNAGGNPYPGANIYAGGNPYPGANIYAGGRPYAEGNAYAGGYPYEPGYP